MAGQQPRPTGAIVAEPATSALGRCTLPWNSSAPLRDREGDSCAGERLIGRIGAVSSPLVLGFQPGGNTLARQ
jgi:hypothetical protein